MHEPPRLLIAGTTVEVVEGTAASGAGAALWSGDEEAAMNATLGALAGAERDGHGLLELWAAAPDTAALGHGAQVILGTIIAYLQPGAKVATVRLWTPAGAAFEHFAGELARYRETTASDG